MICARCGQENQQDAVFCKKCGRRLDGNSICPTCGKLTPADGEYCIYCGSNRNAIVDKNLPFKKEAELSKENETKHEALAKHTKASVIKETSSSLSDNKVSSKPKTKVKSILSLISQISTCLVILFSTIFVFLVGATPTISSGGASANTGLQLNIYYFFSDAFEVIGTADASELILPGSLLGLIVIILAFVFTIINIAFAIKAGIKYIKEKDGNLTKYGINAYFIYLALACIFMLFIATKTSSSGINIGYSLNGGTIAGIILGAIFLLASLVLNGIAKGYNGNLKGYLFSGISSSVITIIGIVSLSLFGLGLYSLTMEESSLSSGIQPYYEQFTSLGISLYPYATDDIWNEFVLNYVGNTICVFFLVAFVLSFVESLIRFINETLIHFGNSFSKKAIISGFTASISLILIGIILLIVDLVCVPYIYENLLSTTVSPEISIVMPIIFMILGVIFLVGIIVIKILNNKLFQNKTNVIEEKTIVEEN